MSFKIDYKDVQRGPGNLRNLAQVSGGERELRTYYLKPFSYACMDALSIMTAYASYDGVPNVANKCGSHSDCMEGVLTTVADLLTDVVSRKPHV